MSIVLKLASVTRHRAMLLLVAIAGIALVLTISPVSAITGQAPISPEGGTESLRKALDEAATGWNQAHGRLTASRDRQKKLTEELQKAELRVDELGVEVKKIATEAYGHGGALNMTAAALDSNSFAAFVDRMSMLDQLSWNNDQQLDELRKAKVELASQKKRIETEILIQEKEEQELAKRKADAERALAEVGGDSSIGFGSGGLPPASPAPRAADGSWPAESCSEDDPTTSGCLTPRTLHALQEAQKVGFTRFTSCYSNSSWGEHGKGRACDFAAASSGFGGPATGDNKVYGNRLAAWFVENANRLGVLYVIWYRQIWMPSTGWRSYQGDGSPSSEHTNHVHISIT